jgi:hypothetical protein
VAPLGVIGSGFGAVAVGHQHNVFVRLPIGPARTLPAIFIEASCVGFGDIRVGPAGDRFFRRKNAPAPQEPRLDIGRLIKGQTIQSLV